MEAEMVKEEESGTLEVVQAIQTTFVTLQKAKDAYTQKGLEFDKLKKENASSKDLEKAETKLKRAQEDYKNLVDKYSIIKEDFEKKMSQACKVVSLTILAPVDSSQQQIITLLHIVALSNIGQKRPEVHLPTPEPSHAHRKKE
uniref:GMIP/FCHO2-like FCH domain-containing protein n=1 Tax=Timema poppense TaxID=170557 RepID=A0A7R9D6A4_TIMPO|nr:unnamed protein product [Timema poppensis]